MDASHSHSIGSFAGAAGPTLVVMTAIHGNEPAGWRAFERVLDWLTRERPRFRGKLVGLAGNLAAVDQRCRFIDEDLNRIWTQERVRRLRQPGWAPRTAEQRQQAELVDSLDRVFAEAKGPVHFMDLHTSSARGEPFVCIGDTLRNRRFADAFPVPVILGLEEQIDGALLEYVNDLGHVTMGVEAGQHDHPESIDRHEAFIVLALVEIGSLQRQDVVRYDEMRALLSGAVAGLPHVLEVRYRHAIDADDGFVMRPGYSNFQPVSRGETLAGDASGSVVARESGRVLLPLYQGLGSDGFFLVREVRRFWLGVSACLRRLGVDHLARRLPGVRPEAGQPDVLLVDPRVARWFAVELFHLLGYRKERTVGTLLRFSRRRELYSEATAS